MRTSTSKPSTTSDQESDQVSTKLSNKEKQRIRSERAAAALKEKQRRERRRQLLTAVGVVGAIALVVAGGFLINSMRDDSKANAAAIPPPGSQYGLTIGSASAPHQVVVYEDFLCPICGEFEKTGHAQLEQLADAGKVQIEYRPIIILSRAGPYSARSTLMWWLVRQNDGDDVALKFHDLLYANQPSEAGPFPSPDDLYQLAGQAGADTAALKTAVEGSEDAQDVVDATKKAEDLGVSSTPTVLLDGKPFTNGRTPADLANNLVKAVQ
jgi:protein-disulfide isomerase